MDEHTDSVEAAIVAALLARLHADREAGLSPTRAEYLAAFPGHEELIARELDRLAAATAEDDAERIDLTAELPRSPVRTDRYVDRGAIARGGMAEIRRAWDRDLRRSLAVKLLEPRHADESGTGSHPQALSRFLEEAQVTAQLAHPGVVAVHDLGIDAEGRAYFSMSLVRGRDLKDVFTLVHEGREGWTRTRALHVLLKVCDTLAYAHSRGVVHRDLKPANVMVGRFGETYVMDWGLARVLDREERRDLRIAPDAPTMTAVASSRRELGAAEPDSPLVTMDGDVVGTPAYMAPEQARGDVERVGPQADVYAIGAMLYQLLAGQTPYVPSDARISPRTVLARVLDGPPAPIERLAGDAPAELVAICEKAMARELGDRYPDVIALGDDLRAFLEMRVVRAYETGAVAELRKWVRRNRPLAAASAIAVLALAAGLVVSLLLMTRADRQAERAGRNARWASEAVDRMLKTVAESALAQVPQAQPVRRDLLRHALEFQQRFLAEREGDDEAAEEVARTLWSVGRIHRALGERDAAERAFVRAWDMFGALCAAAPEDPRLAADAAQLLGDRALLAQHMGRGDEAVRLATETIDRYRALLADDPQSLRLLDNLALAQSNLAYIHTQRGDQAAALDAYAVVESTHEKLVATAPTPARRYKLGAFRLAYGTAMMREGRTDDALAELRAAREIFARLHDENPKHVDYRQRLATVHNNEARLLLGTDGPAAMQRGLELARDLRAGLVRDFPSIPDYRVQLGGTLGNLGMLARSQGEPDRARALLEEGVREVAVALAAAPDREPYRRTQLNNLRKLWLLQLGDRDWRAAAPTAEELARLAAEDDLESLMMAGACLAACVGLVEDDDSLTDSERAKRAARYADRAAELARTARERGTPLAAFANTMWDPIRDRLR